MDISAALRAAAEKNGWTATKVAAECGASEQAAKNWLAGKAMPRADFLERLRRQMPGLADILDGREVAHAS